MTTNSSAATRAVHASTTGRPRRVTDAMIDTVLAWHASRRTAAQLARELGISKSLVRDIVRTRGTHYKQAPPEQRHASLTRARTQRQQLLARGYL